MNDVIRLLPDSVANQIAAGEVIQRPASVIKELVENSVDSGATDIKIIVKDAGKTLIQVIDNGCGMSETDARMAFERHATSKIRNAEDLFTLRTMGFRGEALPSICAISEVEIRTRRAEDKIGTRIVIEGSKVTVQEPCVCDKGTVMMVKKLFFNVPARRKFMKSDSVELANIMREFERMALVNNNINLSIDTGSKILDLRSASLRQRISDIWKGNLGQQLLPIEVETDLVKIHGFVSRPEFARRRNALQYLIVNGRNMRHPYFHKAILSCYDNLIAADTQPCYFVKFDVDPDTIDVNIHPTKNEIKFEYEQQIWPIVVASVKAALGKFSAMPSIDFNADVVPVNPLKEGEDAEMPTLGIPENYNPFRIEETTQAASPSVARSSASSWKPTRIDSNWDTLYNNFVGGKVETDFSAMQAEPMDFSQVAASLPADDKGGVLPEIDKAGPVASVCLQYALKYIITSVSEGLIIIDQHRAHVRILFEEYLRNIRNAEMVSQRLMFPETVTLDETQQIVMERMEPELKRLGFDIEYEEENVWKIMSQPVLLNNTAPQDVILRILDSVDGESVNYGKDNPEAEDSMYRRMALAMARSAAIRRGKKLSVAEMEHLTCELFALPDPNYTPNGNPVFTVLNESRIESLF